jgi:CheY-like chemotaxis protein
LGTTGQQQNATGLIGRLKQVLGPLDSHDHPSAGPYALGVEDLPGLFFQVAPDGAILRVSRTLAETLGAGQPADLRGREIGTYIPALAPGSTVWLGLREKGEVRDVPVRLLAPADGAWTAALLSARANAGNEVVPGAWTGCLTLPSTEERRFSPPTGIDSELLDGVRTGMQSQLEMLLLQFPMGDGGDSAVSLSSLVRMHMVVLPRLEAILALNTPLAPRAFDARSSIAELCRTSGRLLDGAGVNLIFDADPLFPRSVTTDQNRLRTCLNLLLGAASITGNPGEIIVRLALEDSCFLNIEVLAWPEDRRPALGEQCIRQIELSRTLAATADGIVSVALESPDCPKYVLRMRVSAESESGAAVEPDAGAAKTADRALEELRVLFVGPSQTQQAVFSKWIQRQQARFLHAAAPSDARGACSGVQPDVAILDLSVCAALPDFLGGVPVLGLRGALARIPGWCTTFVENPVSEEDLLDAISSLSPHIDAAAWEPQAPGASNPVRILTVEDNPVNQRIMQKMLIRLGYEVDLASNGLEALVALRKRPHDAVLMDWEMPVMDGLEATAAIRGLQEPLCRIPIIAVTAHAIPGDREACLNGGMDDYLSKPLNVELLRSTLDRWLPRSPRLLRREG